jgi:hypothetical protein
MSISCPSGHILDTMEACEVADFSGPVSLITEVSGIETAVTE